MKLGVFVTKRTICSYEYMKITYENRGVENNAPINVNPVGGGGVRARGGDLTNFKIF